MLGDGIQITIERRVNNKLYSISRCISEHDLRGLRDQDEDEKLVRSIATYMLRDINWELGKHAKNCADR